MKYVSLVLLLSCASLAYGMKSGDIYDVTDVDTVVDKIEQECTRGDEENQGESEDEIELREEDAKSDEETDTSTTVSLVAITDIVGKSAAKASDEEADFGDELEGAGVGPLEEKFEDLTIKDDSDITKNEVASSTPTKKPEDKKSLSSEWGGCILS